MAENILHFNGIRIRVVGSGNLLLRFESLDNVISQDLVALAMSSTTDRQPTRLANFISQRGRYIFKTTAIDEQFKINRIIIFTTELWTQFPG